MKIENYTTAGFQCPHCGNIEKKELNLFEYSGRDKKSISCSSCRKAVAWLRRKERSKFTLEVSCIDCGEKHSYATPVNEFLHTAEKSFNCPQTEQTAFVIGRPENVEQILDDEFYNVDYNENYSEEIAENLAKELGIIPPSSDFLAIVDHFKQMSAENKISCDCKEQYIQLQIEENGFRFFCPGCGREMFLDASNSEKIRQIMALHEIHLN